MADGFDAFLLVFVIVLLAIGLSIGAMAIGVMFRRPCLRGSCGGAEALGAKGEKLSCATCPNRQRRSAGPPAE